MSFTPVGPFRGPAQAAFRGMMGRNAARKQRLIMAWQHLDKKEERELADTHREYLKLKETLGPFSVVFYLAFLTRATCENGSGRKVMRG